MAAARNFLQDEHEDRDSDLRDNFGCWRGGGAVQSTLHLTLTRSPSEATREVGVHDFSRVVLISFVSCRYRLKNASGVKASKRGTNLAHTTRLPRLSLPSIITHSLTYNSLTETHSVTHQSELTFTSNLCVDSTDPFSNLRGSVSCGSGWSVPGTLCVDSADPFSNLLFIPRKRRVRL
jgi:hypothetical protein